MSADNINSVIPIVTKSNIQNYNGSVTGPVLDIDDNTVCLSLSGKGLCFKRELVTLTAKRNPVGGSKKKTRRNLKTRRMRKHKRKSTVRYRKH